VSGRARQVVLVAVLAGAHLARGDEGDLEVDLRRDLAVTAAAAGVQLLPLPRLSEHCRICSGSGLDEEAREGLRLGPGAAQTDALRASSYLASVVIPAGALAVSGVGAIRDGSRRVFLEDLVVVSQAAVIAADVNTLSKEFFGRPRPGAGAASSHSFYSSHTSRAFSVAVATATVSTIRGRKNARWVWVAGLGLATGVAYLRVAGDAHWATDVAAGAAAGGAVGFAVPWYFHRGTGRHHRVAVAPAPGGVAIQF
jgi:membrane-associated phospholipid phosphatase